MENQSSLTALMSSFGRIYHSKNDNPIIFNDILSRELMTEVEYEQIKGYLISGINFFAPDKKEEFTSDDEILKWVVQTQIAPTPLARARYCEDALKTAVLTGTRQYVILGAGMDTFAFRNPDILKKIPVFEVDHPSTQMEKRKRVARAGWEVPKQLHFVPLDFTKDDLAETLLKYEYKKDIKTFFSWLGVSYYLTKEKIANMLKAIEAFASEGSTILFDYASQEIFSSPVKRVQNMISMAAAGGEPMKSSFNYRELEQLMEKYRFLIYEHLSTEEIQREFFADRTDYLTAFEHINYAQAVLK